MAIRVVPKTFVYTCDGCTVASEQQESPYSDSRPPGWSRLQVKRDAHDFQGQAVADASIERLLCAGCTDKVVTAINAAFPKAAT